MTEPDRAIDHLLVRLEDRPGTPLQRRMRTVGTWVAGLIGGYGDGYGGGAPSVCDLVVRRRDTGAEVIRTPAGDAFEADNLVVYTEREMQRMTVQEFLDSWRPAAPED